jgi:hypothetical protein
MIGVTGLAFFALTIFGSFFAPLTAMLGLTPLMMAVFVGAAQNILSKSSKYSLFDPCKEMAYIPLDRESKTKGKAAIDVIGNPLGKSGGALIQQILIFGVGSLAAATPVSSFFSMAYRILKATMIDISNHFSFPKCLVSRRYPNGNGVCVVPGCQFPFSAIRCCHGGVHGLESMAKVIGNHLFMNGLYLKRGII